MYETTSFSTAVYDSTMQLKDDVVLILIDESH